MCVYIYIYILFHNKNFLKHIFINNFLKDNLFVLFVDLSLLTMKDSSGVLRRDLFSDVSISFFFRKNKVFFYLLFFFIFIGITEA